MKKHNHYKAHKLRGNKNASKVYRRRNNNNNVTFQRNVVDARSTVRIINNNGRQQQQPVRRLGIAAEHAVSGYRHNGKYYIGGYHL